MQFTSRCFKHKEKNIRKYQDILFISHYKFIIQFTKKDHLSLSKKRWIRKWIQNQIIFSRYIDDKNLNNLKKTVHIYIHIFILLYVFLIFIIAARLSRYFQFRQIVRDASCNRMKLIRCDSTVIIFNWLAVNISLEDFIKKKGISIGDIDQSDRSSLLSLVSVTHFIL